MMAALLDARPRSAGELALLANVSAQSASMHLSQLLTGGFLKVNRQGRYRYYVIAGRDVAHAIEALGAISTLPALKRPINDRALCYARTCYDHLAGELGVQITAVMEQNRVLVPRGENEYELTPGGEKFLRQWQIDAGSLRNTKRAFARRCLDWTERRYHLAGALGAAICARFLERRWIVRERRSRVVYLSESGRQKLTGLLNRSAAA